MKKVNIIKQHPAYPIGEADVTDERAYYLVSVGVAEYAADGKQPVKKAVKKKAKKSK